MTSEQIVEEIDAILTMIREKTYHLEQVVDMRLDLSVLLTMLSDQIGDVHEQQGRAEYQRKKYVAERVMDYRLGNVGIKKTASDAEALALIDAEFYFDEENSWKGLYRKLENKRQALLQVCNALSAIGRDIKKDDDNN